MFTALAWIFSSSLLLQLPAPNPPAPHPDDRRPGATLDPELRHAIDALRAANGIRFEAIVNAHAPQPRALATSAKAPLLHADVGDEFHVEVRQQRDLPLQVAHESLEAFRLGERVAWKPKDSEEWRLFVQKRGESSLLPVARPGVMARRDAEDTRLLRVIAQLATPRELLDAVEGRVTSCTKVTAREGEEGATVFECALEPDLARRAFTSLLAGETPTVDGLTAAYTLRVAIEHEEIAQLALEHRLPLRSDTTAAHATDDGPVETLRRYRIREIGNVAVEVPDEVKRLFEDAASGKGESSSR